ncbi:MAG: ABC transporter permease [Lachnospiraceae bacterium]|nr:ABC transporter permease [Lachnospiraceae bacterium]
MKKYLFKRILFSIFSLLVVVVLVMIMVYSLIEKSAIFQTDDTWNKKSNNDRGLYELVQYQKFGYLTFEDYTTFVKNKYVAVYGDDYYKQSDYLADKNAIQNAETFQQNETVQEFLNTYSKKGYEFKYLAPLLYKSGKTKPGGTGYLFAIDNTSVFVRLGKYIANFFSIETTKDVKDPNLTDRYVRVEKDPYSGLFAVVGSGTQHKYLLYFNNRFPFIHQNWFHINLGTSYTLYRGQEITNVINTPTGEINPTRQQFPVDLGTDKYTDTAIDFHSLTYNASGEVSDVEKEQFPDNYTVYTYQRTGLSPIGNSFLMGFIAVIMAYLIGLPLGISMARHKDGILDKIGNGYIVFIEAVPSLAYIFMLAAFGAAVFHLPYKFATAEVKILAYILPTISLALPRIGGLMKWMRRYMIDQMNSDYVKFARAEGLSEKEIFRIHISRNALIYIVHGIPGSILGCLTGAFITETAYGVPGVGRLLIQAIAQHDNGIVVAMTVFYTALSLISLILGDLLLAKYDPRISLSSSKGGGR